ncbi:nitroreductase [Clostridiales Family XIII bacterium PM5-7]
MKTREAMAKRCSCRAFRPYQISNKELEIIVKGGNAAPVAKGDYDLVKLTVIQNGELLRKLDMEGAKIAGNPDLHPLYGAPTLILVSGKDGDQGQIERSMANASCIIENMMILAADIGLGSCYIFGMIEPMRNDQKLCEELKVPEGFFPCAGVALGYPDKESEMREFVADRIAIEYVK